MVSVLHFPVKFALDAKFPALDVRYSHHSIKALSLIVIFERFASWRSGLSTVLLSGLMLLEG